MRPKYVSPGLVFWRGSPHGLSADLWLLDWLEAKGYAFDVITDEDLHSEGQKLLSRYRVVLTGSHPEYWTRRMLAGLEAYLDDGGRLMYLGGNGFYWVTSVDPHSPHVIEVRRWGSPVPWVAEPGQYYHSTTGELGGTWRNRGLPPQKLVGIGNTAMGFDRNMPYKREPGSFDPRAAFIFDGIGADELVGDFDSLNLEFGAAGHEIDRLDHSLGTPYHAILLATAFGYSDIYQPDMADSGDPEFRKRPRENPLIRSDMVYLEYPNDGAVFSVGSISWCGCLSYNGYDNNVSRITENVLRKFASSAGN
jgi:N,N-dimethylformamidase